MAEGETAMQPAAGASGTTAAAAAPPPPSPRRGPPAPGPDSNQGNLDSHLRPPEALRVIGQPLRRVDALAKVTGVTRFADDLVLPRMLHMKLLRSPHPHARVVAIDTREAEALPGVKAVITGRDLPIPYGILPVSQDEHALALDRVRFVGDPVAAVAAVDEETALAATERIRVEYELLPPVATVEEALQEDRERLHERTAYANVHKAVSLRFGDVEEALASAELVREDLFFYEGNTHLPLEQHAALALFDADARLTVWSSTQTPHYLHRALAKVLAPLPASRIRVIACPNGGGFGGKSDPFQHEIAAAKLAMLTGRPVKICLTREEVFYCHRGRHPVLMQVRTGFRKDGTITGMHFRTLLDGGAYGSYGVASTFYTGALQTVTYRVPVYWFEGARVFTNKPPCGPKRGHGTPQPRFALEVHLDKVAHQLGIDPAELRLRQLQPPHSLTANHLRVGSMGLRRCIEKVLEGSRWHERRGRLGRGRGLGLACSSYISGAGLPIYWNSMPHSGVQLKLDRSGGCTVFCGSTEIGQGSDSVLATWWRRSWGIDPFAIRVVTGDTDLTPVDLGSYSSRVTLMTGNAALEAASRARALLARAVGAHLGVPPSRLVFAEQRVFDSEEPERGVSFAEAVELAEARFGTVGTTGSYTPPPAPGRYKGAGVGPSPAYSYTACVAEVEVDEQTGIVRVPKVWIAHDIGRAINPVLAIGQVEGSVYMGLGEALMEEMEYRPHRRLVHKMPSMLEYKSPTALEMCEVVTYLVEDPDPNGPYGAKEVGQGPLLPVPPAIVNAVHDAVGVYIDEIPLHPHKVLAALKAKAEGREPRYGPARFPPVRYPAPLEVGLPEPTPAQPAGAAALAGTGGGRRP
ncbi:MAG: dehydrogenase [Planctomycetota bacterium]|nr:MAG: dehydrogenase [Planctomycetota bacterium]